MDDTITQNSLQAHIQSNALDTLSESAFNSLVADAFKLYRDSDLLTLSTSLLAFSPLIAESFLLGEPISSDGRGRAVQSLLRWAVDRLRPGGEHSWVHAGWRPYNILHYFYIRGMRASELAEFMAIAEQTLYQSRPQAIATVSKILREELTTPSDRQQRRHYALADRYTRHRENEQLLLRTAAVFPHAIPITLVHQLARAVDLEDVQQCIHNLVAANLLVSNELGTEVVVQPEMRHYLLTLLSPDERKLLHQGAGNHYLEQTDYLEAARQLRMGNGYQKAASILVEYQKEIIDNLQVEEFQELVAQFTRAELDDELWPKLKIMAGELAEFTKDVDAALNEYQQALNAVDVQTKVLAYYRRAKAFESKNIDESLAHYAYCIALMEEVAANDRPSTNALLLATQLQELLVQVYIDRAWIYMQMRPDLEKAKPDLDHAQALIDAKDRRIWTDLHTALAEYYHQQGEPERSIQHYWQAWLAANEVQDRERMSKTAHNLGWLYMGDLQQYDQALDYLTQSHSLSIQTGNRQMEGLSEMSIGTCYFWKEEYTKAIEHYLNADAIFVEVGNRMLQAGNYSNLVEAYAEVGDNMQMRTYFERGIELAQALGYETALKDFQGLQHRYPQLAIPLATVEAELNVRQQQALRYVREHGQITNRDYQRLNQVSQKQAVRDLNDLIEKGILVREGSGRATRYVEIRIEDTEYPYPLS